MEKNGGAKETKFLTSSLESLMLELKWHLPTLRKIEKTSPFSWPDQTFAIENISYLLLQNLCQSSRQASKFTKKSQHNIPWLARSKILQFSFNVNFLPTSPKISSAAETNKVWWDYKEWNHLIPNSVWYGFYLLGSNVLGMFSTAT